MKKRVTAAQKHQLMTKLMGSTAGRQRIAASMQEPLRYLRDYVSVGRKALFVDELPDGAIPVYDMDVQCPAYVVGAEGDNVLNVVRGSRILVPTFEIASNPTIPFAQVKERRFDIVRRVKQKTRDELFRREDTQIFTTLITGALANTINTTLTVDEADYDLDIFADAFANIERHNLRVDKVFMNPAEYKALRKAGRDYVDFETQRELLRTGYMGALWGAQIFQSPQVTAGTILVVSEPEFVGVLPVRIDLTVLPADEPWRRRFGWSVFEDIGIGVHNSDRGVQAITVTPEE